MKTVIILVVMAAITIALASQAIDIYNELQVVNARLAELNEQIGNL